MQYAYYILYRLDLTSLRAIRCSRDRRNKRYCGPRVGGEVDGVSAISDEQGGNYSRVYNNSVRHVWLRLFVLYRVHVCLYYHYG